jgi:murein DD-endopeptidase MepM/ murein hydrolase activator NlpD
VSIINDIIKKREKKYLVPIAGYSLPIEATKIPNAARPYRSDYTDGIHHSWDIDAKVGTPIIALDDGIIVRVVDDWNW